MNGIIKRDANRILLTMAPATAGERKVAIAIAAVSFLLFVGFLPFVRVPLARLPAFIPSYEAALFFIDLITSILLFDQYARLRSVSLLCLATGYLFDALMIVPHALSFPGAFAPTGLLGAKEQTTAWLYVFWHGGFPLFVIAYALLRRRPVSGRAASGAWRPIVACIVGSALLTIGLALFATAGHDMLPVVMQGSDYSLLVSKGISPAVWLLTLVAMIALWERKQRALDLWLMLVMWIWLFDIALAAVIGSTRFDLGFYAGRMFGLIA
ncbi:MAG TPA: MASE4 domain-containing protein, partial [Methylomirabilota bacterium]|nr:MASE4 domain-containing protein [Methylomirabilota bacterium]